jgi:hypothetical protein
LSNVSLAEWDLKNAVVIPNPSWLQSKKIGELENKKVIAVAEIHLKRLDRLLPLWQKYQNIRLGFRNLWKDTTSLR